GERCAAARAKRTGSCHQSGPILSTSGFRDWTAHRLRRLHHHRRLSAHLLAAGYRRPDVCPDGPDGVRRGPGVAAAGADIRADDVVVAAGARIADTTLGVPGCGG